jgi:hypothetical protein
MMFMMFFANSKNSRSLSRECWDWLVKTPQNALKHFRHKNVIRSKLHGQGPVAGTVPEIEHCIKQQCHGVRCRDTNCNDNLITIPGSYAKSLSPALDPITGSLGNHLT